MIFIALFLISITCFIFWFKNIVQKGNVLDVEGYLNSFDTMWLRSTTPKTPLIINSLMINKTEHWDIDKFYKLLSEFIPKHARFYSIPVIQDGTFGITQYPIWKKDPNFKISNHLLHFSLKKKGHTSENDNVSKGGSENNPIKKRVVEIEKDEEIEEILNAEISTHFDLEKPLWKVILYDDEQRHHSFLLFRINHAISDGIGLSTLIGELVDDGGDNEDLLPVSMTKLAEKLKKNSFRGSGRSLFQNIKYVSLSLVLLVHSLAKIIFFQKDRGLGHSKLSKTLSQTIISPQPLPNSSLTSTVKTYLKLSNSLSYISPSREVVTCTPFLISELKELTTKFKDPTTINDLICCIVSGGLRRYFLTRNSKNLNHKETNKELLEKREKELQGLIRAVIPINIRTSLTEIPKLENRFSMVFKSLPVGIENFSERIQNFSFRMNLLKMGGEPEIGTLSIEILAWLPQILFNFFVDHFASRCSLLITNVLGPKRKIKIAGTTVDDIHMWAPVNGDVNLSVSCFSYDDHVTLGLQAFIPTPSTSLFPPLHVSDLAYDINEEWESIKLQFLK